MFPPSTLLLLLQLVLQEISGGEKSDMGARNSALLEIYRASSFACLEAELHRVPREQNQHKPILWL